MENIWESPWAIEWTQYLLDSYARLVKKELIGREGTPQDQAEQLFGSPFVVASHGLEDDPILNYGNQVIHTERFTESYGKVVKTTDQILKSNMVNFEVWL